MKNQYPLENTNYNIQTIPNCQNTNHHNKDENIIDYYYTTNQTEHDFSEHQKNQLNQCEQSNNTQFVKYPKEYNFIDSKTLKPRSKYYHNLNASDDSCFHFSKNLEKCYQQFEDPPQYPLNKMGNNNFHQSSN